MATRVKHTYASRQNRPLPSMPSSPPSELSSPPTVKRKRPLSDLLSPNDGPSPKRRSLNKPATKRTAPLKGGARQKPLTQLHFILDTSVLRSCAKCELSYTVGAPDDEALHRAHCLRVQKGMEWGREEERERTRATVEEVRSAVRLKDGKIGRIVCFRADSTGRLGTKLTTLLKTINLALSSPPLTQDVLHASKAYIFLLPAAGTPAREKIVGCAIAQRISTAMALAADATATTGASDLAKAVDGTALIPVHINPTTSLYVHPTPLPTPLGIPRLFVSTHHRRQGVAQHLLSAAAATAVHGCPLDPAAGQVAFTQPTNSGRAVMEHWGRGGVRIYEE